MPLVVLVGHPITGDPEGNRKKIIAICKEIHTDEIMPVAPAAFLLEYLEEKDWALGQLEVDQYFKRNFVDEFWLYGTRISDGMKNEIKLAYEFDIPVIPKTPETIADLPNVLTELHLG